MQLEYSIIRRHMMEEAETSRHRDGDEAQSRTETSVLESCFSLRDESGTLKSEVQSALKKLKQSLIELLGPDHEKRGGLTYFILTTECGYISQYFDCLSEAHDYFADYCDALIDEYSEPIPEYNAPSHLARLMSDLSLLEKVLRKLLDDIHRTQGAVAETTSTRKGANSYENMVDEVVLGRSQLLSNLSFIGDIAETCREAMTEALPMQWVGLRSQIQGYTPGNGLFEKVAPTKPTNVLDESSAEAEASLEGRLANAKLSAS